MTCGVYCITNLVAGAQYVGRSKRIEERYRQHIFALTSGSHNNKRLLEDWKNYKAETFRFQILQECCDRYLLSSLESVWIARFSQNITLIPRTLEHHLLPLQRVTETGGANTGRGYSTPQQKPTDDS